MWDLGVVIRLLCQLRWFSESYVLVSQNVAII